MSIKEYDKLVRDRIPEIIEHSGRDFRARIASSSELVEYAKKKLVEEVNEFLENPSAEEAADIMEILEFICDKLQIVKSPEIDAARAIKKIERGAFNMGFILEWVEQ